MYCWSAGAVTVKFGSSASSASRKVLLMSQLDSARSCLGLVQVELVLVDVGVDREPGRDRVVERREAAEHLLDGLRAG